jgi:ribosomal protein L1
MDDDQFNINIRKYLKKVGITSQREIENAVRSAIDKKSMTGDENLDVKVTLSIDALKFPVEINGEISLI